MTPAQLQLAINALGLNQVELSRIINVNPTTVRDWVGGRTRIPTAVAMLLYMAIDTKKPPDKWRSEPKAPTTKPRR